MFSKKKVFKNFFKQSKKKVFKNFFSGEKDLQKIFSSDFHLRKTKKGLRKFSARFLALSNKISTVQKIVLSSSRGQGNFQGLEASRPRTSKSVLDYVLEAMDASRTPPLLIPPAINFNNTFLILLSFKFFFSI